MSTDVTNIFAYPASIARALRALRSSRGAFGLPSIITGVVVVAILTVGVFAAVFGVIPAAQDHAARQDLAAVRTAEGVTKTKDGFYQGSSGLEGGGYLVDNASTAVGADTAGSCWIGFVKSQTGAVFYLTSVIDDPQPYTSGADAGCLSVSEQEALAESAGATPMIVTTGYGASWGMGNEGRLGTGNTSHSFVPAAVTTAGALSGKSLTGITAGSEYSCGIADGAAYCWGSNAYGQLGDGSIAPSSVPVAVSTAGVLAGKTVTAISAGWDSTCAIASGAIYCWGGNGNGQLGDGTTAQSTVPVAVTASGALAGKTITDLDAGVLTTCAVADGNAYCWGRNTSGQLGDGSLTQSAAPVAVSTAGALSGKTVTAVSAGIEHACAIAGSAAYCWGGNTYGKLGNGTVAQSSVPVEVTATGVLSGKTVTAVSADREHTCVAAGGAAYCWGINNYGQLGNGTNAQSTVPVEVIATGVLSGKTVTSVSSGRYHSCVVAGAGAYCWGYNGYGQLGNNKAGTNAWSPVAATATDVLAGKKVTAIKAGGSHTVVIYE